MRMRRDGTKGQSAQLGAQFDWRGNRLYVAQQFNDLAANGLSNNRLVGIEAPFGPDGAVYSEYHWSELPLGDQNQAMFGARQRFQATDGLRIEVSGEHSAEDSAGSDTGKRYARVRWVRPSTMTMASHCRRATNTAKTAARLPANSSCRPANVKMALGTDLAVLGQVPLQQERVQRAGEPQYRLHRGEHRPGLSTGRARSPEPVDALHATQQYADGIPGCRARRPNTTSDIFSVDWSYQLSQRIEWVGKQALRWSESDDDPLNVRSQTSLTIQRLNWDMPKKFLLRHGVPTDGPGHCR